MTNFESCISVVLIEEGGFVNNPKDPGGATNFGVTKSVLEAFYGKKFTVDEVKNLSKDKVFPVYQKVYWDKIQGDHLPVGINLVMLDFSVNAGVSRGIKYAQKVLGLVEDGVLGPKTLDALAKTDKDTFIKNYTTSRIAFYKMLSTFPTFGKGWVARANRIAEKAVKL